MKSQFLNNYEKELVQDAEQKAREKGIKEGIKEGINEGKKDVARAMKKDKVPIEKIIKCTGLSPETITNL